MSRSMRDQLRAVLPQRTGPVTPWAPSRRAVARVSNPLPVPDKCPHCGSPVFIDKNSRIYGREYGDWPWALMCTGCDSYVGLHPFTSIPLGTLATPAIRRARSAAKDAFNPLWQDGAMTRSAAYAWLAGALGIADVEKCHIGWFDEAQCAAVVAAVRARSRAGHTRAWGDFKPPAKVRSEEDDDIGHEAWEEIDRQMAKDD